MREDGIVVQSMITPGKLSLEDAKANMRLFEQLADGSKRRLLVEIAAPYSTEPGVREYYASEEGSRWIAALAIVTPSVPARIFGGFSLRRSKLPYPCRMFGTIDRAAKWLLRQPVGR